MLTIKDIARIFRVNQSIARQWYRQGRIRPCNAGESGEPLFRYEDVIVSYLYTTIRRTLRR